MPVAAGSGKPASTSPGSLVCDWLRMWGALRRGRGTSTAIFSLIAWPPPLRRQCSKVALPCFDQYLVSLRCAASHCRSLRIRIVAAFLRRSLTGSEKRAAAARWGPGRDAAGRSLRTCSLKHSLSVLLSLFAGGATGHLAPRRSQHRAIPKACSYNITARLWSFVNRDRLSNAAFHPRD